MRRRPPLLQRLIHRRQVLKGGAAATVGLVLGCPSPTIGDEDAAPCCKHVDAALDASVLDVTPADTGLFDARNQDIAGADAAHNSDAASLEDAGQAAEPGRPFILLQLSDIHIGAQEMSLPAFEAALNQVHAALIPTLTVATGDLVDNGETQQQWIDYRTAVDAAGLTAMDLLEIPGNHDAKGDAELSHFLQYSLTGQTLAQLSGYRDLELDGRRLRVVALNTASGSSYLKNLTGYLAREQVDAMITSLDADTGPVDACVILGHHPLQGANSLALRGTDDELRRVIDRCDAEAYLFGHVHQYNMQWEGRCLLAQASTLGNPSMVNSQPGFSVFSHDSGPRVVNLGIEDLGGGSIGIDWPLLMITRPADRNLSGFNPRADPLPRARSDQWIQAIVAAPQAPDEVSFRVDGGSWLPMQSVEGSLFRARFATPDASRCQVEVRARAIGHTRHDLVEVRLG